MSSVASSASPSSTACTNLYDTPVRDAVCAMPYSDDNIDLMRTCCNGADIVAYYDDCGLYCLAIDQSVADLTDCLYGEGADWEDVFCMGNTTATASATGAGEIVPSASATVVGSSDDDDDASNDNDDDADDESDGGSGSSDDSDGAAARIGSGIAGLLVSSLFLTTILSGAILG